ncbi:hypothetical protein [Planomonospora algeriensis]
MSITLPAPARRFTVHTDPACPECESTDPTTCEAGIDGDQIVTACCGADPVAWTCFTYHVFVYLSPEGERPEQCPYCGTC